MQRIWKALGLQPHRIEASKLSDDPQLTEKARDIVGGYLDAPDSPLVLCVGEDVIQALDLSQPVLPMRPGPAERHTDDYPRHAATSLFAALGIATGKVIGQLHRQHRALEFRGFLDRIDHEVPEVLDLHLVLDDLSTHLTSAIKRW